VMTLITKQSAANHAFSSQRQHDQCKVKRQTAPSL
jgi:hypothetical protein